MTKLHVDLSDAVNQLCHVAVGAGEPPLLIRCGSAPPEPTKCVTARWLVQCSNINCNVAMVYAMVSRPSSRSGYLQRHRHYVWLRANNVSDALRPCSGICRYGGAGAVWDIWPRESCTLLRKYLADHCTEFTHEGKAVQPEDVQDWIHSQVSPTSMSVC